MQECANKFGVAKVSAIELSVALGREVNKVDNAGERRVLLYDSPNRPCQMFADIPGPCASPLIVQRPLTTPHRASEGR